jgi:anthranilate synthase component 2
VILLIDNYDSFVHNLARYFRRLGQETLVVRNDTVDAATVRGQHPAAIVLSPGPCTPHEAGCCVAVVQQLHTSVPMLGVCLGHQAIAAAFGGRIVRAAEPRHGRTSEVFHEGRGIFADLPNPFVAGRYHSLVADPASLPDCLEVLAWTADGTIMALQHRRHPVVGVQFHPESILTPVGYTLLAAFLRQAGLAVPPRLPGIDDEYGP